MLKNAARLRQRRREETRLDTLSADHHHLARLYLAFILRRDQIESAGFGSKHDRVWLSCGADAAHHQRPKAARVAHCVHAIRRQQHQRKRAFNAAQCIGDGIGERLLARLRNQMHHYFGIAGGLKNRALRFQLASQLRCIHQVSVVCQRDFAFIALHHDGLRVEQRGAATGGIACMADGK